MELDLEQFIEERAEHLAVVYLTRHHDLAVERMKANSDFGLDLLVTILHDRLPTGRVFGIQTNGRDIAFKADHAKPPALAQPIAKYWQDIPFPVCVLMFTMDDDQGYCQWVNYPTITTTNLRSLNQDQWLSLDEYPISQLVADVNTWYDQKSLSVA